MYLKVNRKVRARSLRKVHAKSLRRPSDDPWTTPPPPQPQHHPHPHLPQPRFQGVNKKRKKQSVAQMKDQVMTIKTHTESSKSELSSGTFGYFKVYARLPRKTSTQGHARHFAQDQRRLTFSIKYSNRHKLPHRLRHSSFLIFVLFPGLAPQKTF